MCYRREAVFGGIFGCQPAWLSRNFTESQGFREVTIFLLRPISYGKSFNITRKPAYPLKGPILNKKVGVNKIPSTKIELNWNKIARIHGLDELAKILFPCNRNHQRIFLAIFIELKYAPSEFLPILTPLCDKYDFSPRTLETVRSKMRRMGIIDHVSRFNKAYGYREGWVFSNRFGRSLTRLSELTQGFRNRKGSLQERKDRDLFIYL
jgi:hypothetical protein